MSPTLLALAALMLAAPPPPPPDDRLDPRVSALV